MAIRGNFQGSWSFIKCMQVKTLLLIVVKFIFVHITHPRYPMLCSVLYFYTFTLTYSLTCSLALFHSLIPLTQSYSLICDYTVLCSMLCSSPNTNIITNHVIIFLKYCYILLYSFQLNKAYSSGLPYSLVHYTMCNLINFYLL